MQVPAANTGFGNAMALMNMEVPTAEPGSDLVTPPCKKPRLADKLMDALTITPPPVVGRQSESQSVLTSIFS